MKILIYSLNFYFRKNKQTKKRPLQPLAINNDLQNALFNDNNLSSVSSETVGEYDTWDLPRLKQPEKGQTSLILWRN